MAWFDQSTFGLSRAIEVGLRYQGGTEGRWTSLTWLDLYADLLYGQALLAQAGTLPDPALDKRRSGLMAVKV